MNKLRMVFLLLILSFSSVYAIGTPSGTIMSNNALLFSFFQGEDVEKYSMTTFLTVGSIYGLSELEGDSNSFTYPGFEHRLGFSFTNNGNDADDQASIAISSFSNMAGYPITNWNYYLEVNSANVGTNYNIPFTQFGEGAIFDFTLVINSLNGTATNDRAFFTIETTTASNSNHMAVIYEGFNGLRYGGVAEDRISVEVALHLPNTIVNMYAKDGVDTITKFDRSEKLRKTRNTIYMKLQDEPFESDQLYLWYAIDGAADGYGGASDDQRVELDNEGDNLYSAAIEEDELKLGNYVSFLFEVDHNYYATGSVYDIVNLTDQGFESIIINNMIDDGGIGYVKLPEEIIGENGDIIIYSIAGDEVTTILDGEVEQQIYSWDGTDDQGRDVTVGMYFMMIKVGDIKEIRKFYYSGK